MNYTDSNGFAVHSGTGQRMHREAQAVPTAIGDKDLNQVTWSLMEVVKAAGLAGVDFDPDVPSSYRVVLAAINKLIAAAGSESPGRVSIFWQPTAPAGWTTIDGGLLTRAGYPDLWAYVQQVGAVSDAEWLGGAFGRFSYGDGVSTFRKPDIRGHFLRAADQGRGVDLGRVLWSVQQSMLGAHAHGVTDPGHAHGVNDPGHAHGVNDPGHLHMWGRNEQNGVDQGAGNLGQQGPGNASATSSSGTGVSIQSNGANLTINGAPTGITVQSSGGVETRPINIAIPFYMKT